MNKGSHIIFIFKPTCNIYGMGTEFRWDFGQLWQTELALDRDAVVDHWDQEEVVGNL